MKKRTIEEYVENICFLEKKDGHASTNSLAQVMGVRPPTITEVLKKLQTGGYVHYTPHAGATLTDKGKCLAEELGEKHRMIADFLSLIGVGHSIAEYDACQIEHIISHETVISIGGFLSAVKANSAISAWFEELRKNE